MLLQTPYPLKGGLEGVLSLAITFLLPLSGGRGSEETKLLSPDSPSRSNCRAFGGIYAALRYASLH